VGDNEQEIRDLIHIWAAAVHGRRKVGRSSRASCDAVTLNRGSGSRSPTRVESQPVCQPSGTHRVSKPAALGPGHPRARGAALPPRPRRVVGARIHTHPGWTTGPHATLTHNRTVRIGLARWVVCAEAAWERLAVARRHVEVVRAEARAIATVGLAEVRHIAHVARRTSAFCTPCRLTPPGRRTLGERRRPEARQDGSRPRDGRTGSDPLQHPPPGDAVDVRPFLAHGSASRLACSSSPQPCSC
jgi:hypothetical protein